MNFESAASILTEIYQYQYASGPVQQNRARINRLFNGDPPWTEDERKLGRITTNVNFLEGTRIATNSRYQLWNSTFKPGNFFAIKMNNAPIHKRGDWSSKVTKWINSSIRKSPAFSSMGAVEGAHAQVVLHGIGPLSFPNQRCPTPTSLGVDDVLVPTGTLASMENLDRFALYRELTWSQLRDMSHGDSVDSGWNTKYVDRLLALLYQQPLQPLYQGNRWLFPEKMAEDFKENASMMASAALPRILAWDFYFLDEDSGEWNRRMLLDYKTGFIGGDDTFRESLKAAYQRDTTSKQPEFLYEENNYANDWREIIHFFIGNCSNVAPFRYYSIRSVGYLLWAVCNVQNKTRCKFNDAILESLLNYFRNVSDDDREKIEKIDLHNFGIIPDGVSFVNAAERHMVNERLVMAGLQQNRQLMAESASSFLPDTAVEGEKPAMTATESLIRNNASVTLTSAVNNQLYNQSEPFYREMCRRFCLKGNDHPMVTRLREKMKESGIPLEILDVDEWDIIPERVMGGGNKAVELTTARSLFEMRGSLGPAGAAVATRKLVLALTDDPDTVAEIVPDEPQVSDAEILAASAFGTLMQGVPFPPKRGLNEIDYIETLITLMGQGVEKIQALEGNPDALGVAADKIAGLVTVGNHIEQHIKIVGMDEAEIPRAKQYQQAVNDLMGQLKGLAQHLTEMEQARNPAQGPSPEAQAKIIDAQIVAQSKAKIMEANAAQKIQHGDAKWSAENDRRNAATHAELQRKLALTQVDVAATDIKTRAELIRGQQQHNQEMVHSEQEAQQDKAQAASK